MNEDMNNDDEDDHYDDERGPEKPDFKNLMTPHGHALLTVELEQLSRFERPKIVEVVSWAAGNGDRSENGDYLYNKKRLREIDRRLRYLNKRLEDAEIVDPSHQQGVARVFFGATVTYARKDDSELTVHLVGIDEADMAKSQINWQSPVGRALMKASIGDTVKVITDIGVEMIEVVKIEYRIK